MPNNEKYDLTISQPALDFISKFHHEYFVNEPLALVMADLHPIGSSLVIELHPLKEAEQNLNLKLLFPQGYKNYPFSIFVDEQTESSGYLISRILIDLERNTKNQMILVFKNPAFES